ncbi:unnamed protein product [Sphenostylis stenocarpa]|uniref:Uncharacterized protein n=1 Tax=Sphenostylis stenocarpa TaxID=92480 RepID=A0AA86VUQ7_9FABA|nr:unnamed protein product [Sphenostylis stenocarpa]
MRTQTTISRGELGGLCFFGDPCTIANSLAVRKAWERPVYMGDRELGKARVAVTSDYEAWRNRRGVAQSSSTPTTSAKNEGMQAQIDALTQRIEIMGAQMRALEEKEQESILMIDDLQRQGKKKDHEIERLKDQCADANEQAIRASKTVRTSSDSQLQKITAKIAHLEAESAMQAQTIKELSEGLLKAQIDIRQERETNRKLSKSLSELRHKEKEGLAQYGQVLQEKDRAVEKLDELQALVVHQEAKIKEAQKYSEDMSQAVRKQSEALARHVREAERELQRNQDPPVGFFKVFRFCQKLLRNIE